MKVIQINTVCGYGSTGSIAVEIAEELNKYGVDSKIIYGQNKADYVEGYKLGFWGENKIHALLSRLLGLQGLFSWIGTVRTLTFIKKFNPDIVHIHNLHGNYICYFLLLKFLSKWKIPIVFTLHDCWLYTGKCAHYVDKKCIKWQSNCGRCPKVRDYPPSLFFDWSSQMYKIKRRCLYMQEKVEIVGVSKWIANECQKSFLNKWKIKTIYNWIDLEVFRPTYDYAYLDRKGIGESDFVLLGVCGRWSKAKGISDWIKVGETLGKRVKIVLVGRLEDGINLPDNCIHIPYTDSRHELAVLYTRAQIFMNLSMAESFGKTTAEALACETPVIVYNHTACPELVGPKCGYIAHKLEDILEKIKLIQRGEADIEPKMCRKYAEEKFDLGRNVYEYYLTYKELLIN